MGLFHFDEILYLKNEFQEEIEASNQNNFDKDLFVHVNQIKKKDINEN